MASVLVASVLVASVLADTATVAVDSVTITDQRRLFCMPHLHVAPETRPATPSVVEFRPRKGWRGRRRPRHALRPERIIIHGAAVTIEHRGRVTSWQRGTVDFACPRTADWPWWTGPRQCLFVTAGDGEPLVVDCDRYSPAAFDSLTRHLRNFQSIADAGRQRWTPAQQHPQPVEQVPA